MSKTSKTVSYILTSLNSKRLVLIINTNNTLVQIHLLLEKVRDNFNKENVIVTASR